MLVPDYALSELGRTAMAEDDYNEAFYANGWALMPCTEDLFDGSAVPVSDIVTVWQDCTVYICQRQGARYLCASPGGSLDYRLGSQHRAYHDQTMVDFGTFTIQNIVTFQGGRRIRVANEIGLTDTLGVLVFK